MVESGQKIMGTWLPVCLWISKPKIKLRPLTRPENCGTRARVFLVAIISLLSLRIARRKILWLCRGWSVSWNVIIGSRKIAIRMIRKSYHKDITINLKRGERSPRFFIFTFLKATSHRQQATSFYFFFIWWDPPTSSSLILNLWVGPAHKLFSNRDKMSHDPRTVMRQIVTCDNYFLDVTFQQHCCHTATGCANQRTLNIIMDHEPGSCIVL